VNLFHKLWRALKIVAVFLYQLTKLLLTRPHTRPERAAWLSGFCRSALRAVAVTWSTEGPIPMQGAVVTNHLSYLDIVVHGAIRPCVFVSAIETRKMPLIGWISMMAGTVYVTRGGGGSAEKAAEGMAKGFRDKLPVVFFPEGGTFVDGSTVQHFHSGLLAQTLEAGAAVTPGFLRYTLSPIDRGKSAPADVHWGHQSLIPHLWNFLALHALRVHLRFAPEPIAFSSQALEDRKLAAEEARAAVLALSRPEPGSPTSSPRRGG
jgi:1-acyl-sn-glycerol-3-phosphate acyltransferase